MTNKTPNSVRKHRESTQLNSSKTIKLFFFLEIFIGSGAVLGWGCHSRSCQIINKDSKVDSLFLISHFLNLRVIICSFLLLKITSSSR